MASRTKSSSDTVAPLVRAAAAGHEQAWAQLVERFSGLMWSIARCYRLELREAEEVVQTVWLRLAENTKNIREPDQIGLWLTKAVRREALLTIQRRWRQANTYDGTGPDLGAQQNAPEGAATVADRRRLVLAAAIQRMPERDQRLLRVLSASPPPSYREVSAALGIPVASIGPMRQRCLARLRRELAATGIAVEQTA
jgi:RNA polymerase sigma factor (sigma-70 family)